MYEPGCCSLVQLL